MGGPLGGALGDPLEPPGKPWGNPGRGGRLVDPLAIPPIPASYQPRRFVHPGVGSWLGSWMGSLEEIVGATVNSSGVGGYLLRRGSRVGWGGFMQYCIVGGTPNHYCIMKGGGSPRPPHRQRYPRGILPPQDLPPGCPPHPPRIPRLRSPPRDPPLPGPGACLSSSVSDNSGPCSVQDKHLVRHGTARNGMSP